MIKYNTLELFAGAGGLSLGLENAGLKVKYLVEIDKHASSTLKRNRKNWNVINQDIKHFIHNIHQYILDDIDIVSGGFPCQPFSYAGKKLGIEDSRGTLFYDFVKIIMHIKPKIVLAENVKGLLKHNKGKTWEIIKYSFEKCGYKIFYQILNAWHYNVAQKRERIILIGVRNDIKKNFIFPLPLEYKPVLKDILKDVPKSDGYSYPEYKKQIFSLIPPGGCHRNLPEDIAKQYMGKSYFLGGGKTGIARKLSWEEPCLTLTTSPMQKQTDRCHPDEIRPFTIREYARIQSFPDSWIFEGSIANQYKQIGNAVPVNMAYHIGISIKNFLQTI
jgi:DNA (cytosine-5)-methyltransferase 1